MKVQKQKLIILIIIGILINLNIPIYASETNSFGVVESGDEIIAIDGNFDDWKQLPYSWEYNWDNPYSQENYWDEEQQANITKHWLDESGNPYNLEIRHKMQLFCDGEYVYLHIVFSNQYETRFNGYDYQFTIDGETASFQVEQLGGGLIEDVASLNNGLYEMEIHHRDGDISYANANETLAMMYIPEDKINTQLELKIPLSELKEQNPNIDIEHMSTIEFFTPNLMYRKMVCTGTSTMPIIFGIISIVGLSILYKKAKKSTHEE